jgi:hypothetical protein
VPKRIVWAMLKKERKRENKRNIFMPKRHERKMHAKEHEEKKEKEIKKR